MATLTFWHIFSCYLWALIIVILSSTSPTITITRLVNNQAVCTVFLLLFLKH
jgi:hypothetical protein